MNSQASILIVDDEEVVRRSYQRILAGTRCKVEAVWSWEQVLRAMQDHAFDLVLLDLRMPGMDGIAILRELKQRWPDCEVIIITGYPSVATVKQAMNLGAYDYLTKPVGPDHVIEAANAALLHKQWALRSDDDTRPSATAQDDTNSLSVSAGFPPNPLVARSTP
jgi:DNA-binding NtrC family response regulator